MSFSDFLQDILSDRKLSQAELSRRSGIHPAHISHFITGRSEPNWATACKLADALGVSLDAFRGKQPPGATTAVGVTVTLTVDGKQITVTLPEQQI